MDSNFEIYILTTGINLIHNLLTQKYATSLETDLQILEDSDISYRTYLAVTHRTAQKEVLQCQENLLKILLYLVSNVREY